VFWRDEWKALLLILGGFLLTYYLPVEALAALAFVPPAVAEALALARWYAREHVMLCLVPAFFIAGAIGVFISQDAVMRYLGPAARKVVAYGVAAVSGTILAVCSCTVLPLFAGIHKRGAGLGPATTFLYAGPAINVLAIVLTARVLGVELGVARAGGAIGFSVVIGALMHLLFRREERAKAAALADAPIPQVGRPLWQNALFFGSMIGVLVFANWGAPVSATGAWQAVYAAFFASFAGALMYFATLTEVPIVQGLLGAGMGKGPALALLLAGPALSLPSMLVIRSIMGTNKTLVFVSLTVVMATITGLVFGALS
jgi:hypothetical protein